MGNKSTFETIRIVEKDLNQNIVVNFIKNVDKTATLKYLRSLNEKQISFDYVFMDGENIIKEEFEQTCTVGAVLKDDDYFFTIYIQKKNKNKINPLIENKKVYSSYDNYNLITSNISKYSSINLKNNENNDYEKKNSINLEFNQKNENKSKILINSNNSTFSLENYIKKNHNSEKTKEILKLINPVLGLLINKIDDVKTNIHFYFLDYNKNGNLFNKFKIFNMEKSIGNNHIYISFSDLEKEYIKESFIITEFILKNEEIEIKFLITIYIKKTNILNVFINNNESNLYSLEIIYYGNKYKDFEEVKVHLEKNEKIRKKSIKKVEITINNYEEIDSYSNFSNDKRIIYEKIKYKDFNLTKEDFPKRRRYNLINITKEDFCQLTKLKYEKNEEQNDEKKKTIIIILL